MLWFIQHYLWDLSNAPDVEGPAARLLGARDVAVAEGARDPDGVAVRGETRERRDETARPALHAAVVLIGDGASN